MQNFTEKPYAFRICFYAELNIKIRRGWQPLHRTFLRKFYSLRHLGMLLSDLLKAPSNCDPVSRAPSDQDKKILLKQNRTLPASQEETNREFPFLLVLFCAIQSHVILNELFNQDNFVFDVDLHSAGKKIKTKKNTNCPSFKGIMALSLLRLLPQFCSLPVMGFNGLTQFTNMKNS